MKKVRYYDVVKSKKYKGCYNVISRFTDGTSHLFLSHCERDYALFLAYNLNFYVKE